MQCHPSPKKCQGLEVKKSDSLWSTFFENAISRGFSNNSFNLLTLFPASVGVEEIGALQHLLPKDELKPMFREMFSCGREFITINTQQPQIGWVKRIKIKEQMFGGNRIPPGGAAPGENRCIVCKERGATCHGISPFCSDVKMTPCCYLRVPAVCHDLFTKLSSEFQKCYGKMEEQFGGKRITDIGENSYLGSSSREN
ncbi:hypothetical protein HNY73_003606 [Argiope bruennichi]|uniref:Uncharacterized protein n=1 Tax=Argiope bruennichi TaxID=94029 RepID=A0A8T0FNM2_ARGBR|nr:hypothetical protein HNY73_003606 [Argiope bruennichi]